MGGRECAGLAERVGSRRRAWGALLGALGAVAVSPPAGAEEEGDSVAEDTPRRRIFMTELTGLGGPHFWRTGHAYDPFPDPEAGTRRSEEWYTHRSPGGGGALAAGIDLGRFLTAGALAQLDASRSSQRFSGSTMHQLVMYLGPFLELSQPGHHGLFTRARGGLARSEGLNGWGIGGCLGYAWRLGRFSLAPGAAFDAFWFKETENGDHGVYTYYFRALVPTAFVSLRFR